MSVKIEDATSLGTTFATVVGNSIQATGPQSADTAGFQMLGSEVNAAGVGVGRVVKEVEASEDYRLRSGVDQVLFSEGFYGTALASRNWQAPLTTFTVTVGSGAATLNAGAVTTANAVARVTSQQAFKLWDGAPTYFSFDYLYPPAAPVANTTLEMGAVIHTGTAAPTDGAFIRYGSVGDVKCIICYNSVETPVTITAPTTNVRHRVVISIYDDTVNFWIDDVLVASIPTPTGRGMPVSAGALPLSFRLYNGAIVPGQAVSPQIYGPSVALGDYGGNVRSVSDTNVGMGGLGVSTQAGTAVAQLANYANSAAPASATLSNTAAGYTTVGGQWQFAAVGGAETDYALFAWQCPATAALQHNKKQIIRRVRISTNNTGAAVATTETLLQWFVGVGATAVSLATADATTTKAYHRLALGTQVLPIAAAIGAEARDIDVELTSPLIVLPGEFGCVGLKMPRGTATASQIIRGIVAVIMDWE